MWQILNLEQQLKQQAGEDKKFFSEDTPQGKADQKALEELAAAGEAQLEAEEQEEPDEGQSRAGPMSV